MEALWKKLILLCGKASFKGLQYATQAAQLQQQQDRYAVQSKSQPQRA